MIFNGPLLVVEDIQRSRTFYETLLGQKVVLDFGENISFESNFFLLARETYADFLGLPKEQIRMRTNNFELYFEEDDFDAFLQQIEALNSMDYVHPVTEYPWGQRVIRFYDPDGHIVEVGQSMKSVIQKFLRQGMTREEVAEKTQHPIEFVAACME